MSTLGRTEQHNLGSLLKWARVGWDGPGHRGGHQAVPREREENGLECLNGVVHVAAVSACLICPHPTLSPFVSSLQIQGRASSVGRGHSRHAELCGAAGGAARRSGAPRGAGPQDVAAAARAPARRRECPATCRGAVREELGRRGSFAAGALPACSTSFTFSSRALSSPPPLCCMPQELLPPLWRTEMPLVRVIVDMEAAGLGVDEAILNAGVWLGTACMCWWVGCAGDGCTERNGCRRGYSECRRGSVMQALPVCVGGSFRARVERLTCKRG